MDPTQFADSYTVPGHLTYQAYKITSVFLVHISSHVGIEICLVCLAQLFL